MSWFDKDVHGSDTFYGKSALKSGFFAADTLLLILVSFINFLILLKHGSKLDILEEAYLLVPLIGMWLLWGVAWGTHRRVRTMFSSGAGQGQIGAGEQLARVCASITHMGMFLGFLVNGLLLAEIGFLLRRVP